MWFKKPSGPRNRFWSIDSAVPDAVQKIGVLLLRFVLMRVEVVEIEKLHSTLPMSYSDSALQCGLTWGIQNGFE